MKIIINTASTFKGGGVQVAKSFIEECKCYTNYQFYVILGKRLTEVLEPGSFPGNFSFFKMHYRPATRVLSFKSQDAVFKKIEKEIKPDVVFTTSGPAYWRPEAPHLVGYNLPHYIYRDSPFFDQIPIHQKIKWDLKGAVIKHFFKRDADAFVVQTDDVNRRLKRLLGAKNVFTVSNTVSQYYQNPQKLESKLPDRSSQEFRFITLSAWHRHKNLGIIPKVIDTLNYDFKKRIRFVLTLPDQDFRREIPSRYKKYIYNLGPIPPEEGPSLYKECDALFLPTLLECFSASYVEAMQLGKPIVTSDLGFAHSVCQEAAVYVDPLKPKEIASKLKELVETQQLQRDLIRKGRARVKHYMTASERAEAYLKLCKNLVDEQKN